jgi:hypothetical protein
MVKTGQELATACLNVAKNYKTLYVMGCFGAPLTERNKVRYTTNHSYNKKASRTKMINAASEDTFGFDCVCFLKALLWGWCGDKTQTYGGAKYASGGVPDVNADGMIELCKEVSTDFSKIQIGEAVWLKGHIGIYVGDGLSVECTPSWKNCVQVTVVRNIKSGTGHKWTKHGKLPWLTYEKAEAPEVKEPEEKLCFVPMLKKGSKGESVKALQILLSGYGYSLGSYGIDSDFGSATENAVEAFQEDNGLEVDGVVGPMTWAKLLGV